LPRLLTLNVLLQPVYITLSYVESLAPVWWAIKPRKICYNIANCNTSSTGFDLNIYRAMAAKERGRANETENCLRQTKTKKNENRSGTSTTALAAFFQQETTGK